MTEPFRCDNCGARWFFIKRLGAVNLCSSCYFREVYMDKPRRQRWNKRLEEDEKTRAEW